MKRQGRLSRRLAVGALVGTLVLGVSTFTLAAIPETGTGVITGCYNEMSGALRVIDAEAGATCRSNERQVTWNHTGPQGPAGNDGADGKTVLSGTGAPTNTIGTDGDFYLDTTAAVLYGPKSGGSWPTPGLNLVGRQGAAGKDGADGKTVLNGIGAPANTIGTDGDFYLDTSAAVLYGPKSAGSWPTPGLNLVGPQGAAGKDGADGKTVLSGAGPPANTIGPIGTDGDFYLDTSAAVLYGPKAGKSWPAAGLSLVGQQGPQGPAGPPGVGLNPLQIATLRWYEAATGVGVNVDRPPSALTFDGAHVWVGRRDAGLIKLRAADGAVVSTPEALQVVNPDALAFDGINIWALTNTIGREATLTSRAAADGSGLRRFTVLRESTDIAFDGSSIWVAGSDTEPEKRETEPQTFVVRKLRAVDGVTQGTFTIPGRPSGLAFDGANVWVTGAGPTVESSGTVTKLRASDGFNLGTFTVGVNPSAVAFDGASVWVANAGSDTVTKIGGGAVLGTFRVGDGPKDLVFDGTHVWVANGGAVGGSITKLRVSDGFVVGSIPVKHPSHLAFDGANVWVASTDDDFLRKL